MITETKKIKLTENLEYALGLQFLERLENSGRINAVEKKILRDILEDVDGNPRVGETVELMKKELRKMKVAENREEPFKKEEKAFYVKNDNRARIDKWRNDMQAKGFVRSESNPRYFRMASRSNYVRDRLNFGRQNSNVRSNSRHIFNQEQWE